MLISNVYKNYKRFYRVLLNLLLTLTLTHYINAQTAFIQQDSYDFAGLHYMNCGGFNIDDFNVFVESNRDFPLFKLHVKKSRLNLGATTFANRYRIDMNNDGIWEQGWTSADEKIISHTFPNPANGISASHTIKIEIEYWNTYEEIGKRTKYQPITIFSKPRVYHNSENDAFIQLRDEACVNKIPVLLVEGIDPLNENYPEKYYGLTYPIVNNDLYPNNFEVFILNFNDGGRDLRHNAAVVLKSLEKIHELCPNYKIVIGGLSMGGLISRYALADYENRGKDHHTGLFISFDSPQKGAHLNPNLQDWIKNEDPGEAVIGLLQSNLNSVAAKQLLLYNTYDPEQNYYQEFYAALDQLNGDGYPHKSYNAAVSNGTLKATYGYEDVGRHLMTLKINNRMINQVPAVLMDCGAGSMLSDITSTRYGDIFPNPFKGFYYELSIIFNPTYIPTWSGLDLVGKQVDPLSGDIISFDYSKFNDFLTQTSPHQHHELSLLTRDKLLDWLELNFSIRVNYDPLNGGSLEPDHYQLKILHGLTVEAAQQNTTVNGTDISYSFVEWDDGNKKNPREIYTSSDIVLNATMKGHLLSGEENALGYNNSSRITRVGSILYMVYTDDGSVFLTQSNNNGQSWNPEILIARKTTVITYKNPTVSAHALHIVYEGYNSATGNTSVYSANPNVNGGWDYHVLQDGTGDFIGEARPTISQDAFGTVCAIHYQSQSENKHYIIIYSFNDISGQWDILTSYETLSAVYPALAWNKRYATSAASDIRLITSENAGLIVRSFSFQNASNTGTYNISNALNSILAGYNSHSQPVISFENGAERKLHVAWRARNSAGNWEILYAAFDAGNNGNPISLSDFKIIGSCSLSGPVISFNNGTYPDNENSKVIVCYKNTAGAIRASQKIASGIWISHNLQEGDLPHVVYSYSEDDRAQVAFQKNSTMPYSLVIADPLQINRVTANINTNTDWDGVYTIENTISLNNGADLIIRPGSTIFIKPNVNITVNNNSKILAEGTEGAPIRFLPESAKWGRLYLYGDNNAFKYCTFNEGSYTVYMSGSTDNVFENCVFTKADYAIRAVSASEAYLKNCLIYDNNFGIRINSYCDMRLTGNQIYDNNYGIYSYSANSVKMYGNVIRDNKKYGICAQSNDVYRLGMPYGWPGYNTVRNNRDGINSDYDLYVNGSGTDVDLCYASLYSSNCCAMGTEIKTSAPVFAQSCWFGDNGLQKTGSGTVTRSSSLGTLPAWDGISADNDLQMSKMSVPDVNTPDKYRGRDGLKSLMTKVQKTSLSNNDKANILKDIYSLLREDYKSDYFAERSGFFDFMENIIKKAKDRDLKNLILHYQSTWKALDGRIDEAIEISAKLIPRLSEEEALSARINLVHLYLSVHDTINARQEMKRIIGLYGEKDPLIEELALELGMRERLLEKTLQEDFGTIPENFFLSQNYPNPFNPSTTIRFGLPEAGHVTLVIYNVQGRLVKKLVDSNISAGTHSVYFDASRIAGGVYFYKFKAGNFMQVKRMLLIK